jgi:DNA polymerase-3 subunit epsilon
MLPQLPDVLSLTRPFNGLDLETTSTNPATARIVELALEIMRPGQPVKEYRTLVNPCIPIPHEATYGNGTTYHGHGITDEMVKDAPTFEQLADNLIKGFTGADFGGYNVRFDIKILQAEFARCKRRFSFEDARIIDGFRLWQVLEPRSLTDAVTRWVKPHASPEDEAALDPKNAHGALWDIRMSTRTIASQLLEFPNTPRDLDALHELCSPGWFDIDGKLQWRNGSLVLTFGEHRDKPLHEAPEHYLRWILKKDFSNKVKWACAEILEGRVPHKPN